MEKSFSDSYRASGVDITAGYRAVELMKEHVRSTFTPGVITDIGGFGGLFAPDLAGIREPVLVSGTDGVGTKLKLSFMMDRRDTVGIDCVAMCVNDVAVCGARPLFFLDYIACGKNVPEKIAEIVSGVAEGCRQAGCALIGGETAEMPGFYPEDEFDLAGFSVGLADRGRLADREKVRQGDLIVGLPSTGPHSNGFSLIRKLIAGHDLSEPFGDSTLGETLLALPSSGVHSNGYSLVRKVFYVEHADLGRFVPELGQPLGEALLTPTRIYVKTLLPLIESSLIKSAAHITGGGFYENIPRSLPDGLTARIEKKALRTPEIFRFLREKGNIPERDMFNTFNMGVGMTLTCDSGSALKILSLCPGSYVLGEIAEGDEGVVIA